VVVAPTTVIRAPRAPTARFSTSVDAIDPVNQSGQFNEGFVRDDAILIVMIFQRRSFGNVRVAGFHRQCMRTKLCRSVLQTGGFVDRHHL